MHAANGLTRVAALGLSLMMAGPAVRAEPHEPLATFFADPPPATHARPNRVPVHRLPAPAVAAPRMFAARRPVPPNAKPSFVVGVFGDAFAAAMARGLSDGDLSGSTQGVVDASADDASVSALDAGTWDQALDGARKDGERLDAAVVMVGRDDGVPLTDDHGQRQDPGSPGWRQLYGDRVAAIADRFRDKHVPLIWVGLPIVREAEDAKLYASLNEVAHDRVVREGAVFVDTWQAFADENGDFSTTGPDVDGRPATLRWNNGWNFTRTGARKLASFVLPDLNRIRDRVTSSQQLAAVPNANPGDFDQALDIDVNAQILREAGLQPSRPAGAEPATDKIGPVLVLTAAPLASDGRLASIDSGAHPVASEPPGSSHAGRADDFAWPGK